MFDTMQVGRRIRQARIEKNMTQMALADAMGVSYQAVSNWERGNAMPDISKLPELCELLGITFETLVGGPSRETETVGVMAAFATKEYVNVLSSVIVKVPALV